MSALRKPVEAPLVDGEFPFTLDDFHDIARMLYADSGIHLQEAKATLVYSRLAKRVRKLGLASFADYRALLHGEEGGEDEQSGGGARQPEFASTHPDPGTRIERLKALMPKALQYRARFCTASGTAAAAAP